ncbi:hypothetical protein [Moraxella lincolnii]|uniref:HTH cro/C1-type domain-containing protein n=1 Tax=Lwoffella lincolnii TaxID=90241 RepID=A0A1T0CKR0_9GAMM|nr:hypothetical protein [Moraxella lincolnii]OOS22751.1 hypothetical protein B0682_00565 [Moraxella lincolnii]
MKNQTEWTNIVRELLKHQTQTELSSKTGIHQGVISELNRGKPKPNLSWRYGNALMNAYNNLKQENHPS